jgi:xanthine dehydrogenase YagS FAD-binding subunit
MQQTPAGERLQRAGGIRSHASDFRRQRALHCHASIRFGARSIPLHELHPLPGTAPERETTLAPGEVITSIDVPASPFARRSLYIKLRERASYEFALVSAAVALDLDGRTIREARIALGGVAPKPWRLAAAEAALRGVTLDDPGRVRAAVERGFSDARPGNQNGFKVELATRLVVRGVQLTGQGA